MKVPVRMVLAVLWICHFILWIFGDYFNLLLGKEQPASSTMIEFVATTTAVVLTLMVVFTLVGHAAHARLANLVVGPVYLVFDLIFFVDATQAWEYYLGVFYVLFIALIFWRAYTWHPYAGTHPHVEPAGRLPLAEAAERTKG